jgi:hypothetical protein
MMLNKCNLLVAASAFLLACGGSVTPTGTVAPGEVVVQIQPPSAQLGVGGSASFSAAVTGTAITAVTWSVQEGAAGGSVTSAGMYTATLTSGTYHVVVTSQADSTKSATATVTVTAAAPVITSFSASPGSVTSGSVSTLSWTLSGGSPTSLSISPTVGSVLGASSVDISPTVTTAYTLTASNYGGTVTASATVTVPGSSQAAATPTFSSPTGDITSGTVVTVSTTTPNATIRCTFDGTAPTAASAATTTFTVTISETVQCLASAPGLSDSNVASTAYVANLLYDDFTGGTVNAGNWIVGHTSGTTVNGTEQECYSPSQVTVAGGKLVITTVKASTTCPTQGNTLPFNSGMLMTNFSFGPPATITVTGTFAMNGDNWPAIWLLGSNCWASFPSGTGGGCNWPNHGGEEIDIMEEMYGSATQAYQSVHSFATGNPQCVPTMTNSNTNAHVFQFSWTKTKLTWKIDGVTTCTQAVYQSTSSPSLDVPMFLIINVAVGGPGGGGNTTSSQWPTYTNIDYVKITSP